MQSFPDRVSDLARTVPVGRPVGQDRGRAVCSGEASVRCHVFRARIRSGFRSVFPSRCPGRLSVSHVSGRLSGVHSGLQPLRVRLQVPNGSVPLRCIRTFLAVAARPCRLFARQPGGFVVPCGSDLRPPDRRVTGCQGCRSAGTNPDAKIAKKFCRAFPPARPCPHPCPHPCPSILSEHPCPRIPVRVSLFARSCPVCRRLRSIRLSVRSTLSPLFPSESPHRFLHSRCPCPDRPARSVFVPRPIHPLWYRRDHRTGSSICFVLVRIVRPGASLSLVRFILCGIVGITAPVPPFAFPCPDPPACREKTDSRPVASVSQRRRDFDAREFGRSAKSS